MATIRSLKEVRKQYKEKALETAQVSTGPQPSPPVSECDFYSTATDVMDDAARMKMSKDEDESKVVESENEGREVHSIFLFFIFWDRRFSNLEKQGGSQQVA